MVAQRSYETPLLPPCTNSDKTVSPSQNGEVWSPAKPALTQRVPIVSNEVEQGETMFGTVLKVITCGLGSGILTAPWGAAGASIVTSCLLTAVVLVANAWTVMIIVHAIDRWGGTKVWDAEHKQWLGTRRLKGYRIGDFGELLRQAPKPLPTLATVWDVTVNLSNFGVLVGYMIVTGDAMAPLMQSNCDDLANRRPWILLGSLVCLPLCWADHTFLTYSSAVGVLANMYLFFVLVGILVSHGPAAEVCTFGMAPGTLTCMSNLVFSVIVQMCIPEYYTQLRRDDQEPGKFLNGVLIPSFGFIFVLMCAFSTVGYLAFGSAVSSNVMLNFPPGLWSRGSQVAICVACLMVYPNMLRPMVQPLLRGVGWVLHLFDSEAPAERTSPVHDIYEGRLVHTELIGPIQVDWHTGDLTLDVADTRGFEKDALVFVDGSSREYAIVKDVLLASHSPWDANGARAQRVGKLRLRPRYGADPQKPIMNEHGCPELALHDLMPPPGSKVVLDEDPVLVTAAVAGEKCLHMSFTIGIAAGTRIIVGEGVRAERHKIKGTGTFAPERESTEAGVRTHDLVLRLGDELRHNHGAHSRVVLDTGTTEAATTAIVFGVLAVALVIDSLGVLNVANGALSVAIIIGLVPGFCAWYLNTHWRSADAAGPNSFCDSRQQNAPMPLSIRYKTASVMLAVVSVGVGLASTLFTENHTQSLVDSCMWRVG